MKVSHSNTLWLGYKLYSSFVLHGRITLLPLPTLPLGRHHSLQHPCYHYLADSCITYEPYTVLLIGKVFGGITDQHSESGCFVFFLKFSFSRPSFISSFFSVSRFVLSLYLSFILSLSFLLFIVSYILLFFLSLVLPFVLPFRLSFDLFIFHSFILFFSLPTFLSFSLSFFCSFFLTFFCCFFPLIILSH